MRISIIRFSQRQGATSNIPWHYSFYKEILEKRGHVVDIIDNQVENLSNDALIDHIIQEGTELVGTGGIGTVYSPLKDFVTRLKAIKPQIHIVVGGHITADYDFILHALPIDIVVRGEGEYTLPKVVSAIEVQSPLKEVPGIAWLENGKVQETEAEELIPMDELPDFNFNNLNPDKYDTGVANAFLVDDDARRLKAEGYRGLAIFLARGCPYTCFFCYRHLPKYRTYSGARQDRILADLKARGFAFLVLGDECTTANKRNLREICEQAKKHGIYWFANGRADHTNHETLSMLAAHNCIQLQIGIESFDADMLKAMNKKVGPEKNIESLNLCYRYGIHSVLQLVIGTPGENRQTLFNTRKGMWSCYFKQDKIACAVLNPYPGSPAYWYGIEKGLITDKEFVHREFSDKGKVVVNLSDLTLEELEAWQYWLPVEAGLSYRVKQRTIKLDRGFLSLVKQFLLAYLELAKKHPWQAVGFVGHLLKGASFWFKPTKRLIWAELRGKSWKPSAASLLSEIPVTDKAA